MWAPWHWTPLLAPGLPAKWGVLCTNDREDDQAPVTSSHPHMTTRTVIMKNRSTRLGALTQATGSDSNHSSLRSVLEPHHFPQGFPSIRTITLSFFLLGLAPGVSMSTQYQRYTYHEVTSHRHWPKSQSNVHGLPLTSFSCPLHFPLRDHSLYPWCVASLMNKASAWLMSFPMS